jgi:Asp-tRNA(Asn)/Glu-tRNA(Gln) amidotransferase A subunit family amidase
VFEGHDATTLAALVRRGETTPAELLRWSLDRLALWQPRIRAVVRLHEERAWDAVAAGLPDAAPDAPFRGVPFLLKDLSAEWAGVPTTMGSRLFEGRVAARDSAVVRRAKEAGLVVFGQTATPELALSLVTEPATGEAARNPWDPSRTPGGSSGGSAAAVAARVVPMAHATDGGGSIRGPASCCGLFGLKPTRGRVSYGPAQGENWGGLSHAHALTVTVRDSAALLDAFAGPEPGDPYAAPHRERPYAAEVGREPGRLRIAFSLRSQQGAVVAPEVAELARGAARLLEALGHDVEEASPEVEPDEVRAARLPVMQANVHALVRARLRELGRDLRPDDLELGTLRYVEAGERLSAADLADAVARMHALGRRVAPFFARFDALLTPTMALPPVPVGHISLAHGDMELYQKRQNAFGGFGALWNITGQPAMSVPLCWTADGLPVGMQFAAAFGREDILFRLAGQLERAQPWAHRRPPDPEPFQGDPR